MGKGQGGQGARVCGVLVTGVGRASDRAVRSCFLDMGFVRVWDAFGGRRQGGTGIGAACWQGHVMSLGEPLLKVQTGDLVVC